MRWLLIPLLLGLCSCDIWQSREDEMGTETHTRTYRETGTTEAGVPFSKQGSEEIEVKRETTTEKKSGIDDAAIQRAVGAAMAGVTGDLAALRSQLAAAPKPITGNQTADQMLAMLVAYLGGRGGLAGIAHFKKKKPQSS